VWSGSGTRVHLKSVVEPSPFYAFPAKRMNDSCLSYALAALFTTFWEKQFISWFENDLFSLK